MFGRINSRLCAIVGTITVLSAMATAASASNVFSAVSPRFYLPSDANPLYYNVGPFTGPNRILFDDVPVTIGDYLLPSVNVKQVTFDISRKPNASAMTVTAYWAPLVLDNTLNGGAGDGPNDDPGAPILIGSINLPVNGAAHTRQTITFGNGTSTLFNTGPLNQAQAPGYGMFALGLNFSDTTTNEGWTVGTNLENSDLLWDYNTPIDFDEFTYDVDGFNQPIIGTQMMTVTGDLVPEPGSISILLGGATMLLGRRSRRQG